MIKRETTELVRLTLSNGRELLLTETHLNWVGQVGWINVDDVSAQDVIHVVGGRATSVLQVERLGVEPTATYTLQVAGTRTYFAGGVWVHTSCFKLKWADYRKTHVRLHNQNDLNKKYHGVFYEYGVDVAEEAAEIASFLKLTPRAEGGRRVLEVPMGRKIGWKAVLKERVQLSSV